MAITGDGTSLDTAYLVHDYWELKVACSNTYTGNTNSIKYIKLANDIDCNTNAYSNDFEWEGINLYYDAVVVDLNLNNKSIKNVMIANDSYLFRGYNNSTNYSKIHDGKILNVFCNSAKNIINSSSISGAIYCHITNVSMSVNGTSLTGYGFIRCQLDCCSLYYQSAKLNNYILYDHQSGANPHKNTDFYIDVKTTATLDKPQIFYNYSTSSVNFDNCRISGNIYKNVFKFYNLNNCVFDVFCKPSLSVNLFTGCSGIYNRSKMENDAKKTNSDNMIEVTSTEIKSASILTEKGFVVANISPSTTT